MEIKWNSSDNETLKKLFLGRSEKATKEARAINIELQKNNENLVIYHNLLQDIKTNLIGNFPQKFKEMLEDVDASHTRETYQDSYNPNVFTKNSTQYPYNMFKMNSEDFYKDFCLTGGVEKKFFKIDRNLLTLDEKLALKDFKTSLNSNIIKENNIENTKEYVKTLRIPSNISDNLKMAYIETILDKQKDLKDKLLEYNYSMISKNALELTKKSTTGHVLDEQVILDNKIELIRELYKSVFTYKESVIDKNGEEKKAKFSSYAFHKIVANCTIKLNKIMKQRELDNSIKKVSFENIDFINNDEIETIYKEKQKINDTDLLNHIYSIKNDGTVTENIFRSLLAKDGYVNGSELVLDKALRIVEECDSNGVEFLKAALYENGLGDDVDADPKWIETFKKYYQLKQDLVDDNVSYLKIYKELGDKPEKTNSMYFHMKKEDIDMDYFLNQLNEKHRPFMKKLIERDYSSIQYDLTSKFNNEEKFDVGKKISLNLNDYYGEILAQNKMKDGLVFGNALKTDSELIKIDVKDIDISNFKNNYKTKYFIEGSFDYGYIPESTKNQYANFKESLAKQLSQGNYEKVEKQYIGKYQFDAATLAKYGLIDKTKFDSLIDNTNKNKMNDIYESFIKNPSNWTSNKCSSLEDFLKNGKLQEELMDIKTMDNYKQLNSNIREYSIDNRFRSLDDLRPWENFGLLSVAHVAGIDNTMNLMEEGSSAFTNQYGGKVLEKYYKIGKEATKVDINQSLYQLEHKQMNFQDISKDYTIAERMFNPLVQFEYFGKEFIQLFQNIGVAINNHRFANAQKEIENLSYDKVLGKIEKDMQSSIANKTNIYNPEYNRKVIRDAQVSIKNNESKIVNNVDVKNNTKDDFDVSNLVLKNKTETINVKNEPIINLNTKSYNYHN